MPSSTRTPPRRPLTRVEAIDRIRTGNAYRQCAVYRAWIDAMIERGEAAREDTVKTPADAPAKT